MLRGKGQGSPGIDGSRRQAGAFLPDRKSGRMLTVTLVAIDGVNLAGAGDFVDASKAIARRGRKYARAPRSRSSYFSAECAGCGDRCVVLVAATAASAGTTQASGVQSAPVSISDPCFEASALESYAMEGSLVGCWHVDTFDVRGDGQPSGTFQATGQEHFVGCVDLNGDHVCGGGDPQGVLTFTYTFTGKLDTVTLSEIHGRCHHVVVAGTGAFAGASGGISFHDDVASGTAPYRGHVTLT